jgi:hypothetical protein
MSDFDMERCKDLEQEYTELMNYYGVTYELERLKEKMDYRTSGDIGNKELDFYDDSASKEINQTREVLEGAYEVLIKNIKEKNFDDLEGITTIINSAKSKLSSNGYHTHTLGDEALDKAEKYKKSIYTGIIPTLTDRMINFADQNGIEPDYIKRKYRDIEELVKALGNSKDFSEFYNDISKRTTSELQKKIDRITEQIDELEQNLQEPSNEKKITQLEQSVNHMIEKYADVPGISAETMKKNFEKTQIKKRGHQGYELVDHMHEVRSFGKLNEEKVQKMKKLIETRINYLTKKREIIVQDLNFSENRYRIEDIDNEIEMIEDSFAKEVEGKEYGKHHQARLDAERKENEKRKQEEEEEQKRLEEERAEREAEKKKIEDEKVAKKKLEDETRVVDKIESTVSMQQKIPDNLMKTYNQLVGNQNFYCNLANKLGIHYQVEKIDAVNMAESIKRIKNNITKISIETTKITDENKIDSLRNIMGELSTLSQDNSMLKDNNQELMKNFTQCFDMKIQQVIKDDKMQKLDQELARISGEKISFFGKLAGKQKLKDAKIENVLLRKQTISQQTYTGKEKYSMEDSLSDLYEYIWEEYRGNVPANIVPFFKTTLGKDFAQICSQEDVKKIFQQKRIQNEMNRQKAGEIMTQDQATKISPRAQAKSLNGQNKKMREQNNRQNQINTNNLQQRYSVYTPSANSSHIKRFMKIVNEIDQSVQIEDRNTQNRTNNRDINPEL